MLRGTVVGEDGAPIEGGTLRFWAKDRPAAGRPPTEVVPIPPTGPDPDRYVNVSLRGEFTLRLKSRLDYEVRDLHRIGRGHDAEPRWEVFDPVVSARLLPDAPNVVVVKRRED